MDSPLLQRLHVADEVHDLVVGQGVEQSFGHDGLAVHVAGDLEALHEIEPLGVTGIGRVFIPVRLLCRPTGSPVMVRLVSSSPESASARSASRAAWWIGGAGLLLSAVLTLVTWRDAVKRDEERFAAVVEQVRQELETRVEGYERELRQLAEWFGGRPNVTAAEWENRVERMKLTVNFPAFSELLFAETVRPRAVPGQPMDPPHVPPGWELIHRGYDFRVRHQVRRPGEKQTGWNRDLLRFEPAARERRLMAELEPDLMNRISGTLSVRCTRRRLLDDGDRRVQAAFTFLAGAHAATMPAASEIQEPEFGEWHRQRNLQRLESLVGVVAATLLVEPLLESIFGGRLLELDFDLYAGPVAETNRLTRLMSAPVTSKRRLGEMKELPWYGDRWHLMAAPNDRFFAGSQRSRAFLVAGAGLLLSLTLAGFVHTQTRARAAAEAWGRDLEAAREQLRVAHREREQFGRNLHDGVLQSLYAAVLSLQRARRATAGNPPAAGRLIEEVVNDLEDSMQTIRGFLTSAPVGRRGAAELPELLRGYVAACNRLALAEVSLAGDPEALTSLPDEHAEQVMPLLKEAVSNAQRHGHAARIEIRCERRPDGIHLTVTDDGQGFEPDTAAGSGYGLRSMRERMEHCGGNCGVESRPGGPTVVRAVLPARTPPEAAA